MFSASIKLFLSYILLSVVSVVMDREQKVIGWKRNVLAWLIAKEIIFHMSYLWLELKNTDQVGSLQTLRLESLKVVFQSQISC